MFWILKILEIFWNFWVLKILFFISDSKSDHSLNYRNLHYNNSLTDDLHALISNHCNPKTAQATFGLLRGESVKSTLSELKMYEPNKCWQRTFQNRTSRFLAVYIDLVTDNGDKLCWWQLWDVGDSFKMLVTDSNIFILPPKY